MFRSTFLYYDFLWLTAYKDLFLFIHFLAIISTIKERFFFQISIVTFLKNMEVEFKYNLSELRSNNNLWTYWGFKSCKLALISIDINWLFLKKYSAFFQKFNLMYIPDIKKRIYCKWQKDWLIGKMVFPNINIIWNQSFFVISIEHASM